jgi:hypothetical protein
MESASSSKDAYLHLSFYTSILGMIIENENDQVFRFWDINNSWGWTTFLFSIAQKNNPDEWQILQPKSRIWTRNGPGYIELYKGHKYEVEINTLDFDLRIQIPIEEIKNERLLVRGHLRVPTTPEALKLEVFTGELISPVYISEPPHIWLFETKS